MVAQSNDFAAAHQAFHIHDKRLLLTAISHITMANDHLPTLELGIPTYRELWGLRHGTLIQDLKNAVQRLKHATTTISTRDGDATLHLFDTIDLHHGHSHHTRTTTITMRLHDDLAPHLLQLSKTKRGFLKIPLAYYTPLYRPTHIRLYELLLSQARGEKLFHATLELPDLCHRLGLSTTKPWAALNRDHIQPALTTLENAFLLHATATSVTESRKVTHVQFTCDDWSHTFRYPKPHLPTELAQTLAILDFDPKHPLLARARQALGDDTVLTYARNVLQRSDTYGDIDQPAAYLHTVLETHLGLKGIPLTPSAGSTPRKQHATLTDLADSLATRIANHVLTCVDGTLARTSPTDDIRLATATNPRQHLAAMRDALTSRRPDIHAAEMARTLEVPRTPTQLLHLAQSSGLLTDVPRHQQPQLLQLIHERLQELFPAKADECADTDHAVPAAA